MTPVSFLETSVIYCDDNLHRLAQFPAECVDLIYLDPPFFSNRNYEVIWGDEAEIRSFEDRWEGGIQVYVNWMRERVIEMRRVLRPTGSIYLHCDWHASHYLKVMMDDVFGTENFVNEIIWHYHTGGATKRQFSKKHDVILMYGRRESERMFNPQREPYREDKTQHFTEIDDDGRRYRVRSIGGKDYVYYLDEGRICHDVWDIDTVNAYAKERLGYPTQKPEALLDRIIKASSNEGAIVLDPFAGCGTTMVVAETLRRKWIGIDISPTAVELIRQRMTKVGAKDMKLVGMPVSEDQLHALKPFEFQNWVIQRFSGTHAPRKSGDMGIDGYSFFEHFPIQVKQSESVGRNVVDNFETAVERAGKERGFIVAFSFTRGAYEEAARAKAAKNIAIQLVRIEDLLADRVDLVTPAPSPLGDDVVLPQPRSKDARPSAQDLVESDKSQTPTGGDQRSDSN